MNYKDISMKAAMAVALIAIPVASFANFTGNDAKKPNLTPETKAKLESIMSAKDYNAWVAFKKENGGNPQVFDKVTAENFLTFADAHLKMMEAHKLMQESKDLLKSIGIEKPFHNKVKRGGFKRGGEGFGRAEKATENPTQ